MIDTDIWEIERFFLAGDEALTDREVTRAYWVSKERAAGFHPKGEDRGQPATGGFSAGGYRGSVRTYFYSHVTLDAEQVVELDTCLNCRIPIVKIMESTYMTPTPVEIYRHWDTRYPHNIGPHTCDAPPIRLVATPS